MHAMKTHFSNSKCPVRLAQGGTRRWAVLTIHAERVTCLVCLYHMGLYMPLSKLADHQLAQREAWLQQHIQDTLTDLLANAAQPIAYSDAGYALIRDAVVAEMDRIGRPALQEALDNFMRSLTIEAATGEQMDARMSHTVTFTVPL